MVCELILLANHIYWKLLVGCSLTKGSFKVKKKKIQNTKIYEVWGKEEGRSANTKERLKKRENKRFWKAERIDQKEKAKKHRGRIGKEN